MMCLKCQINLPTFKGEKENIRGMERTLEVTLERTPSDHSIGIPLLFHGDPSMPLGSQEH